MGMRKDKRFTLDKLIELYEISNQADGKSPKTTSWYTEILGSFVSYLERNHLGTGISVLNINVARDYVLYLRNRPRFSNSIQIGKPASLSPRTVQCHVRALKAFSTWLYLEGHTPQNILQNMKMPKAPTRLIEPLTPQEIKKVVSSINRKSYGGERNHAVLVTLLDSGLRTSEAAGITLNNLNLKDGCIKVMGKGSKERTVPIGKFVQMELLHYIEKIRPEPFSDDSNELFLSQGGKAITSNTVKLVFSRLAKSSGVSRLHAHLCRHTFAINYLLNGGDIFSLKNILGHTSLDMVNHYLHFTSAQITDQHRKYSPMDKLQEK